MRYSLRVDDAVFWQLVDNPERIATLSPEEILAFHDAFARRVHAAYRFDLMAVSNIVNGSRTGEGFDAFVGWLIERGQTYFEAALRDASRAADAAKPGAAKSLRLWHAPAAAYEKRTGKDDFELEARPISLVMEGGKLDEAEVRERFSELVSRFGW